MENKKIKFACSILGVLPQNGLVIPLSCTSNSEGIPENVLKMLLLLMEMCIFQETSPQEINKEIFLLDCIANKKRSALAQNAQTKTKATDFNQLNANLLVIEQLLAQTQETVSQLQQHLDNIRLENNLDSVSVGFELAKLLENLQRFDSIFATNIKPWMKMQKGVQQNHMLQQQLDTIEAMWQRWTVVQQILQDLPTKYNNCLHKSNSVLPVATASESKITNLKLQSSKLDNILSTKNYQQLLSTREASSLSPNPTDLKSAI